MTIFITVGNGKFDHLVKEIDRLKEKKTINDDVVIQLGHGSYKPSNCKWFTFEPSLDKYYNEADLVISHGGPGIVFEVLRRKKKLVAVPNRNRIDPNHQVEYLRAMANETSALIYCNQVQHLQSCLEKVKDHQFEKYQPKKCKMHENIYEFLR